MYISRYLGRYSRILGNIRKEKMSIPIKILTWSSSLKLIQEKFEIAHDHKLPDPAFFDASWFGNLHIPFVCGAYSSCWINAQRPFSWKIRRKRLKRANTSSKKKSFSLQTWAAQLGIQIQNVEISGFPCHSDFT